MSTTNTNIQVKRSADSFSSVNAYDPELSFGEPFFIDNTIKDTEGNIVDPCNAYLVIGRKPVSNNETVTMSKSPVIKTFSQNMVDKLVFYDEDSGSIINEAGQELPVDRLTVHEFKQANIHMDPDDPDYLPYSKYHVLCQPEGSNIIYKFSFEDLGIYINNQGVMKGAAWNDYAELRPVKGDVGHGRVVCDNGNGEVEISSQRLQACPHVVSDTYGHIIGSKKGSIPIAVSGRALVYVDSKESLSIGDCVCASNNGCASKMTRQEIMGYPDRILGVVCEIPEYNMYNDIEVDGRVWVNIK